MQNKMINKPQLEGANQMAIYNRGRGFELGRTRTNPESGQSRIQTEGRRIASPTRGHSASPPAYSSYFPRHFNKFIRLFCLRIVVNYLAIFLPSPAKTATCKLWAASGGCL